MKVKTNIIKTMGKKIKKASSEIKTANLVLMRGGSYYIEPMDKEKLIKLLVTFQEKANHKVSLVPITDDNTIFFADIDAVKPDFNLDKLIKTIVACVNATLTKYGDNRRAKDTNALVFKREIGDKYHIYVTINLNKAQRKEVWKLVNELCGYNVIDTAASTIRFEGFEKWDSVTKKFTANSRYLPMKAAADLDWKTLYNMIWLKPKGWGADNAVNMDNDLQSWQLVNGDKANEEADEEAPRQLRGSDEEEEKEVSLQRSPSPDITINANISAEVKDKIMSKHPEVAHILLAYPIKSYQKNGKKVTLSCDKSEKGRYCNLAGRTHRKNNIYLLYDVVSHAVYQRCFSPTCLGQHLLYRPASENSHDLPVNEDRSIADYFYAWKQHIIAEQDGKTTSWYIYDEGVGYWKKSTIAAIMNLFEPFLIDLKADFEAVIEKNPDEEHALYGRYEEIRKMLGCARSCTNIAQMLKWKCVRTDVPWNSNPAYTVFPNGVLQVDKRDEANPNLYYFGRTRPEELINDNRCMRKPFNCPPLAASNGHREQAQQLMRDWFKLIQPKAEDLVLLLQFMSLVLSAVNYKKMVINLGESGNNSKSSCFEMLVYVLGSYGLAGDKRLIVRGGQKDRVSIAEMSEVRFITFEEPDPAKALDVEFLKDLVGGSMAIAGRFNFSNNNKVLLHCKTALNANVMTSLQLQEALFERILFFNWETKFTSQDSEVNPAARVYKADPKYKTTEYWDSINDGLIWLLICHYRMYENNGFRLTISEAQTARTTAGLLDSDLFIKWFKANYVVLADTVENKRYFVTQEEIINEFKKLAPTEQWQIIGKRNYDAAKFVKDILRVHLVLKRYYAKKVTNHRISRAERLASGAKNKTGPNRQYQSHVLRGVVTAAEFATSSLESEEQYNNGVQADPVNRAHEADEANEPEECINTDEYLVVDGLFYEESNGVYEDDIFEVEDDDLKADHISDMENDIASVSLSAEVMDVDGDVLMMENNEERAIDVISNEAASGANDVDGNESASAANVANSNEPASIVNDIDNNEAPAGGNDTEEDTSVCAAEEVKSNKRKRKVRITYKNGRKKRRI